MSTSASFAFSLPTSGTASLQVFDLSGRLVSTLASGEMEAGVHSVVWNADDTRGAQVPDGIYIARLASGGGVLTTTCVVLR